MCCVWSHVTRLGLAPPWRQRPAPACSLFSFHASKAKQWKAPTLLGLLGFGAWVATLTCLAEDHLGALHHVSLTRAGVAKAAMVEALACF